MKQSGLILLTIAVITGLFSCTTATISENWVSPEGLKVTESVYYNADSSDIYVSNINGKPTERNSEGFISKLSLTGEVIELQWVTGLNAPKGMGVYKNNLYVTDIDSVHTIDISTGNVTSTTKIEGAKFLNDIVVDSSGLVYISDTGASKLYTLDGSNVNTWLELNEYKKPNGLLFEDGKLLIGTSAGLVTVDMASKTQTLIIPLKGGIDGLKALGNNSYVVSDWKGKIQIITSDSEAQLVRDTTDMKINAADFEYFSQINAILVPTFFDNRVELLHLN